MHGACSHKSVRFCNNRVRTRQAHTATALLKIITHKAPHKPLAQGFHTRFAQAFVRTRPALCAQCFFNVKHISLLTVLGPGHGMGLASGRPSRARTMAQLEAGPTRTCFQKSLSAMVLPWSVVVGFGKFLVFVDFSAGFWPVLGSFGWFWLVFGWSCSVFCRYGWFLVGFGRGSRHGLWTKTSACWVSARLGTPWSACLHWPTVTSNGWSGWSRPAAIGRDLAVASSGRFWAVLVGFG